MTVVWKTGTLPKGIATAGAVSQDTPGFLIVCQCLGTRKAGQGLGGLVVWEERLCLLQRGPLPQTGAFFNKVGRVFSDRPDGECFHITKYSDIFFPVIKKMHKPFLARGQNEVDREVWSSLQLVTPEDQSSL